MTGADEDATPSPDMDVAPRGRRWFPVTLVVLALGAALLLLASSRTWSTTTVGGGDLPTVVVDLTGSDLTAGGAVALLALAGLVALSATRRAGRIIVGTLLVLAGLAVAYVAWDFSALWNTSLGVGDTIRNLVAEKVGGDVADPATTITAWWVLSLVAGLVIAAGGVLAIVTSGSWPQMGRRYERPAGADTPERDVRPRSAWDQLDEGIDPTEEPPPVRGGDTTTDPTLGVGEQA